MNRDEVLRRLAEFKQANGRKYLIVKLGVFGSVARDHQAGSGDVDVVVELTDPDLFTVIGIKQDLEELLHCSVDVVRYRPTMNAFLKERIDREAVYV